MADEIRIRAVRPCLVNGQAVPAGAVLKLPALDAALALDSGRCELVDGDDAAAILQARRAELSRTINRLPHVPAGWPWQPLR